MVVVGIENLVERWWYGFKGGGWSGGLIEIEKISIIKIKNKINKNKNNNNINNNNNRTMIIN